MIPVTKPFFPPIEEYYEMLEDIWAGGIITNNGPLVKELEQKTASYLGINNMVLVGNGTVALQIALKSLQLSGEIITTPFSYIATTSSILWEGIRPVFVDIDPDTLNIDPGKIKRAISKKTTAILATHVFGNPCNIEAIREIADRYQLKVIYDAAHCFGTTYKGRSVYEYGDISTASFHATKIFHTTEGGALFSSDKHLIERFQYMRNFGHDGPEKFNGIGINGKCSELHAAMGLCNLAYIDQILERRKEQVELYEELLNFKVLNRIKIQDNTVWNRSYFPVIFQSEETALFIKKSLEDKNVFLRRYFYPSLETLNYVPSEQLPVSNSVAGRILCLPLYHELKNREISSIAQFINSSIGSS